MCVVFFFKFSITQSGLSFSYFLSHIYCKPTVLPALCPSDPALDYKNLEGVQNGNDASAAFARMAAMAPEERNRTRENLLKYCGLDTLAMVKVWEKLKEAAGSDG